MSSEDQPSGKKKRRGRPPKLSPKQVDELVAIVQENPLLSLDDTVDGFRRQTGVTISSVTVRKYLLAAGFTRSRPTRMPRARAGSVAEATAGDSEPSPRVYGYDQSHRDPGDATRYPCGLTDSEWEQVAHLFDPPGRTGRPEKYPRRQMLDACIYVLRSGCSWRMLPKEFPGWNIVYKTFRRWQVRGLFESMYDELRKLWRSRQHRAPDPTAAVLDAQSVKTSPQGGPKGFDAGKKVKGRKRHLVTDTLGLLITVLMTTACTQDRDAAMPAMERAKDKVPGIQIVYVDAGYAGSRAREVNEELDIKVEVVRHPANRNVGRWQKGQQPLFDIPKPRGFVVLPKRWVVERTNAWNLRPRRLTMDHDRILGVSASWIWLAEGRRLLRRLTVAQTKAVA